MKGGTRPLGYTIVEVMIVLAVSGVMFVIAASFISGKQARTTFATGTNELNSQIQTIITQVVNGQYSDINFSCAVIGSGPGATISFDAAGSRGPGLPSPCDFVGKAFQPIYKGATNKYAVFSMAGIRDAQDYSVTTAIRSDSLDLTDYQNVPQNLDITKITVVDSSSHTDTTGAIALAFAQSLGAGTSSVVYNGAQTVGLYWVATVPADPLAPGWMTSLKPATSATLCVSDGTRYATITLGDNVNNANQLSATLQVVTSC